MTKRCRVCGARGRVYMVLLDARHKSLRRQWLIEVCQGCWRVFEAMLDEALVAMQPHLSSSGGGGGFLV